MSYIRDYLKTHGFDEDKEIKAMNRAQLLHAINLLTAVSQGKQLQQSSPINGIWVDVQIEPSYPNTILMTHSEQFRVKPEPKYREWKLEEFPVGAVARRKSKCGARIPQVIIGADIVSFRDREQIPYAVMHFEREDKHTATQTSSLLEHWEWKWAHEPDSCWRPCGAVEVA